MEPRGQPDLDVSVSYVQVLSAQRNQLLTAFTTEEHAKTRYEEIAAQLNQRMKELTLFELEAVIKDRKLKELKDALEKERRELEMKTQMTTEMEKRIEAQEALISQLEMQVRSTGTVRSLLEEDESKQLKAYRIKESPSALQSSAR